MRVSIALKLSEDEVWLPIGWHRRTDRPTRYVGVLGWCFDQEGSLL